MDIFTPLKQSLSEDGSVRQTEDERSLYRSEVRFQRRRQLILERTSGMKCPRCRKVIKTLKSWVVLQDEVVCRSCYYRKDHVRFDGNAFRRFMRSRKLSHQEITAISGLSMSLQTKLIGRNDVSAFVADIMIDTLRELEASEEWVREILPGQEWANNPCKNQ